MAPHLTVHTFAGTQVGSALTPITKRGTNRWKGPRVGEDGSGRFTANGSMPANQLADNLIIRLNDGTRDIFAFKANEPVRRAINSPDKTEVDLSGPGVMALLHDIQLLQEDTSDCADPADTRPFGWMSAAYDIAGLDSAVSFGLFIEGPFATSRPKGWVDPLASYIAPSTAAVTARDWYAWRDFTVSTEQEVIIAATADDEFQMFLEGDELFNTLGRGPFGWKSTERVARRLCAGTYRLAVRVRNLQRAAAASNVTWLLASVVPANTTTGEPEVYDAQYAVYHDATGGTFELIGAYGVRTTALDFDATTTEISDALEALAPPGVDVQVTVTGAGAVGDPWIVTFGGDWSAIQVPLSADGTNLTGGTAIEVDTYVQGGGPDPLVRTDTDWVVLDDPADVPGLTATHMMRLAIEEGRARGDSVADSITLDFTDAADSDSVALDEIVLPVPLDADVHRLKVLLEELGYQFDMAPDLTLSLWADRGTDLSATVSILAHDEDVTNLAASVSRSGVKNVLRVRTDEGWHEVTDSASVTARGRVEAGLGLDGFASAAEAEQATGPLLTQYATPPRVTRCDIPSEAAIIYDEAGQGDIVTASAWSTTPDSFDEIPMRITGIDGRVEEQSIVYSVELVD